MRRHRHVSRQKAPSGCIPHHTTALNMQGRSAPREGQLQRIKPPTIDHLTSNTEFVACDEGPLPIAIFSLLRSCSLSIIQTLYIHVIPFRSPMLSKHEQSHGLSPVSRECVNTAKPVFRYLIGNCALFIYSYSTRA